MSETVVVVARITLEDGEGVQSLMGVASGHYTLSTAGLLNGTWYPILDPDISFEISVSLPWESGAPQDSFGVIRLAGGGDGLNPHILDLLLDNRVVGLPIEVRRGTPDQTWEEMETWTLTHAASVEFEGNDVVITQRSSLDVMDQPLNSTVFDETVPNPRLVNKTVPNMLGEAFQLPVILWDPQNLIYYVAQNLSNVRRVQEGGFETTNWDKVDFGFQLTSGANLQITADAVGPPPTSLSTVSVYDLDMTLWTADDPDGAVVYETPPAAEISQNATDPNQADVTVTAAPTGNTGFVSFTDPFEPIFSGLSGNTDWTAVSAATVEDAVVIDDGSYAEATILKETTLRVAGIDPAVPAGYKVTGVEIEVIATGTNATLTTLTANQTDPGTRVADYIVAGSSIDPVLPDGVKTTLVGGGPNWQGGGSFVREDVTAEDVNSIGMHFTLKFAPTVAGSATLQVHQVRIKVYYAPTIEIVRLFSNSAVLTPGERHTVRIEMTSGDIYARWGGVLAAGDELADSNDPFSTSLSRLNGASMYTFSFVPSASVFGIEFKRLISSGAATINRIRVDKDTDGVLDYPGLVDYMATQMGIAAAVDTAAIQAHADATGNPRLGWYLQSNETMAQIMSLFATSLSGVWWRDRDGMLRSRLWSLTNAAPVASFTDIEIDGELRAVTIQRPVEIKTHEAPLATARAVGAKNWNPIDPDRAALVTSEFTEQDRANVFEPFRIIRRADFDALNPWSHPV